MSRRLVATLVAALSLLAPASAAHAADYVALGDSYAAGTGTRSYTLDEGCNRSTLAYPSLIKGSFGGSFSFVACSGAKTSDVLAGQVGALSSATQFVTMSIGGNDAGFTDVLTTCAGPSWLGDCNGRITTAQNYIRDTLPGLLDTVYTQIRTRAPNATVAIVGYPRLFSGEDCNVLTFFDPDEQTRFNQTADQLATLTSAKAAAHGFAFVDLRSRFNGHAVCQDPEWINGISNPISDSYHPNVAGHRDGMAPLVGPQLRAAVPPVTTLTGGPSGLTGDATPTFTFGSDLETATLECRVDGGGWAGCTSPRTTATLADGPHTFAVRGKNAAGWVDRTPAQRSFTVDATAPAAPAVTAPPSPTASARPELVFTGEAGATFECATDAGAFAACTSPFVPAALGDGTHTLRVVAIDAALNRGPAATATVTVDTTAPVTTIGAGPSGPTRAAAPTFEFASEPGATFTCRIDAGTFAPCASPFTPPADLADGPHAFEVRAADAVGNLAPVAARREFVVDTTGPATAIQSGPSGPTKSATPAFGFTAEDGATFACRIDAGDFTPCRSPFTAPALADGPHAFEVRATDALGNPGAAARRAFAVDTTPPVTAFDAGPTGPTPDPTPTFAFASEPGATYRCRIDTAVFASCSSPYTAAALADGPHAFEVRTSDALGNTATPVRREFVVDTTGPVTTFLGGPEGVVDAPDPTFTFAAEDGATFECRLDDGAFEGCASPVVLTGLAAGDHVFEVRGRDALGNPEAAGPRRAFTVATTPPPPDGEEEEVPDPPAGGTEEDEQPPAATAPDVPSLGPPAVQAPAVPAASAPAPAAAVGGSASRSTLPLAPVPVVDRVTLSRRVLRRGGRASTALLRFRLSAPAALTVRLERRTGRRFRAARTLTAAGAAGPGRLEIAVRVRGRALAAGTYRLTLTPQGGAPARLTFRVAAR